MHPWPSPSEFGEKRPRLSRSARTDRGNGLEHAPQARRLEATRHGEGFEMSEHERSRLEELARHL